MSVRTLKVGECLDLGMTVDVFYSRPCESDHDGEVTARPQQAEGAYPSAEALEADVDAACRASLSADLLAKLADEEIALDGYVPSPMDWAMGDRDGICIVSRGVHEAPLVGHL